MGFPDFVSLLGGIALFLFGMSIMGDNLKKVAGNKLELILYRLSSTPIKGVLLGTGVTAVIQSSSATSVMVVGFVNSGMMKVNQAIGIVMGAVLGTSITGWILCLGSDSSGVASIFSTEVLTGLVAVIGIVMRMVSKKDAYRHTGKILLGFAVLMYGMSAMSSAVSPLRESKVFIDLLTTFSNPLLGILLGMVFTAVIQSASAAVGILQALSITGVITFEIAFPIIMGVAIGAAVPVLLSSFGANANGKRTAFSYLIVDVIGVVIGCILFYGANAIFHFTFTGAVMNKVAIAFTNTAFRLVFVLIEMPFINLIARIVAKMFPEDANALEEIKILNRLEERFLDHPPLAVEQCRVVTNAMAEKSMQNLFEAMDLSKHYSDKAFAEVEALEGTIDRYEDKLNTYLMKITKKSLTKDQTEAVTKYLHTVSDFERISDHALNIAEGIRELFEKKLFFSDAAFAEMNVLNDAIHEIVATSVDAFVNNDLEKAHRVEPLEELIDNLVDEMKLHHINRQLDGVCTIQQGYVFNDLTTNFERVADHCSNIAVAVIELNSDSDASFDTHEYLNSISNMKNTDFQTYYEEYKNKYQI